MSRYTIGTRGSRLALAQTELVRQQLTALLPEHAFDVRVVTTTGDWLQNATTAPAIETGLFVREIEAALLTGEVDLAVHSLKDLPTEQPRGLTIAAVPQRGPTGDVLVSRFRVPFFLQPPRVRIGTGSVRRAAQLLHWRPDLRIVPVRGNVDTRVAKAREGRDVDAVVLAHAGLARLGMEDSIMHVFSPQECLPAPGQGALAVECRADDDTVTRLLAAIEDRAARACVTAERAFERAVGGGCNAPVAALATLEGGALAMSGLVASRDGRRLVQGYLTGAPDEAPALGERLAANLLARGAGDLPREGAIVSEIGFVSLVGAGPGDAGLITVRGRERLAAADVVVYDRLAAPELLALAAPGAELRLVGKQAGLHAMRQEDISRLLVELGRAGKRVCRLKGGDPFLFGRGEKRRWRWPKLACRSRSCRV